MKVKNKYLDRFTADDLQLCIQAFPAPGWLDCERVESQQIVAMLDGHASPWQAPRPFWTKAESSEASMALDACCV